MRNSGDPGEIPDLEPVPSRRAAAGAQPRAQAVQPPPASSAGLEFDAGLEEDWIGGLGSNLLDLDLPERNQGAPGTATAAAPCRWPTGTRPDPESTDVDPAQLRPLCTWGETPGAWWQTPLYALAVYRGQRELTRELDGISVELRQVESRRDAYLCELAQQLRDGLEGNTRFDSALRAVRATEASLEQCRCQFQQTETTSAAELDAIDAALRTGNAELAELQESLEAAQAELDNAELGLQREQARVQRLGIERRNLEQLQIDEQRKQGKLAELSAQAAALMPTIDACRLALQSRRARRSQIEASAAQKQSEMDNLKSRRRSLERDLDVHLDSAGAAVAKANSERNAALAELGRGILVTKGQVHVSDAQLTELVRFDDAVAALCHREQLYRAALASYDRAAVKRGLLLTVLALVLLVVWCVWRAPT